MIPFWFSQGKETKFDFTINTNGGLRNRECQVRFFNKFSFMLTSQQKTEKH